MSRKLTFKELEDIAYGAALLGGGELEASRRLIRTLSKPVTLVDYQEIQTQSWGATLGGLGTEIPNKSDEQEVFKVLSPTLFKTFERLEKTLNRTFSYTLGLEIGANLFTAMIIASERQIPIVDGDGAGRGIAELEMTTYSQVISVSPTALSNVKLDTEQQIEMVVSAKTSYLTDQLARNLVSTNEFTTGSAQIAIIATYAMSGQILQEKLPIIPGTISLAQEIGSTLRQGIEKGDPVKAVLDFFNNKENRSAFNLFEGTVDTVVQESRGGFAWDIATISNGNQQVRVLSKIENLIAWSNENQEPIAMGPDTICYLTGDGKPVGMRELKPKDQVTLLGIKANERLRKGSILQSFLNSLQEWGYYGPYIPIEKLQNTNIKTGDRLFYLPQNYKQK